MFPFNLANTNVDTWQIVVSIAMIIGGAVLIYVATVRSQRWPDASKILLLIAVGVFALGCEWFMAGFTLRIEGMLYLIAVAKSRPNTGFTFAWMRLAAGIQFCVLWLAGTTTVFEWGQYTLLRNMNDKDGAEKAKRLAIRALMVVAVVFLFVGSVAISVAALYPLIH